MEVDDAPHSWNFEKNPLVDRLSFCHSRIPPPAKVPKYKQYPNLVAFGLKQQI
jgi:hypothetical protein